MTYNEALIEEREQGINEIAQQIGEVNEIFQARLGPRGGLWRLSRGHGLPSCCVSRARSPPGRHLQAWLLYHNA